MFFMAWLNSWNYHLPAEKFYTFQMVIMRYYLSKKEAKIYHAMLNIFIVSSIISQPTGNQMTNSLMIKPKTRLLCRRKSYLVSMKSQLERIRPKNDPSFHEWQQRKFLEKIVDGFKKLYLIEHERLN